MGPIDTLKAVLAIVKRYDNTELTSHVVELQGQVYELVVENGNLKTENLALRTQASTLASLAFKDNAYWKHDGTGPFCSRCFDAETKLIRLHIAARYKPQCPSCGNVAVPI